MNESEEQERKASVGEHEYAGLTGQPLLSYYGEVCRSHEAITDFRAKLLALLPIVSGTGIGLLVTQADGGVGIPTWLLIVLGPFGAVVTVGLFFFEFRQMDECRGLRNHGIWIEKKLGIPAGRFALERGDLGLRQILRYGKRESEYRDYEREGRLKPPDKHRPLDEHKLGLVNVRVADYFVYGAVFLAWIFVLVWGIIAQST
jgi:hypothetical protein